MPKNLSKRQKFEAQFAKKNLGQNFLQDGTVINDMIESVGELSGQNVLEIGPGLGALTSALLANGANVAAVELDNRVYDKLNKKFAQEREEGRFRLIEGDILSLKAEEIFPKIKNGEETYQIIANIPYQITNPIFRKFLETEKYKPTSMTMMVQKEVAEKIVNAKKSSILSLSVAVYGVSEIVRIVDRACFLPIPRVDSAVIQTILREKPLIEEGLLHSFFKIINTAFKQKRKKLKTSLKPVFDDFTALEGIIDLEKRAETLEIEDWAALARIYEDKDIK